MSTEPTTKRRTFDETFKRAAVALALKGEKPRAQRAAGPPPARVNQELKRRTRVARVFPNEKSLLRLISALLAETSDDWETGKIYLNMENQNPPSV